MQYTVWESNDYSNYITDFVLDCSRLYFGMPMMNLYKLQQIVTDNVPNLVN